MTPQLDRGVTVWFTGLPSSGKTTLATALEKRLADEGRRVELLDGDVARTHLTRGLGFSREDRDENVRRIGFVAHLLSRNGVVVLCSVISPFRSVRDELRLLHAGRFFEVYVSA
ncbi:MAG: adenylyl-sulfate kinase, partial [Acidimicrobiales bacterium]